MKKCLIYKLLIMFFIFLNLSNLMVFASKADLEKKYTKDETDDMAEDIAKIYEKLDNNNDKNLTTNELNKATDEELAKMVSCLENSSFTTVEGIGNARKMEMNSKEALYTVYNKRRKEEGLSTESNPTTGITGFDKYYSPGKVGDAGTTGSNLEGIIDSADEFVDEANDTANVSANALQNFSSTFYGIFLAIATAVTVIVGIVVGIKYMTSSAGEKANVKQMLVPYVVGCIVVYGSFGIWALAVSLLNNI